MDTIRGLNLLPKIDHFSSRATPWVRNKLAVGTIRDNLCSPLAQLTLGLFTPSGPVGF